MRSRLKCGERVWRLNTLRIDVPHQNFADMQHLAEQIADLVAPRAVVLLNGPLGAGKTTWVQAMCRRLGVRESVTSPTFDLLHIYQAEGLTIYHVDGYRLTQCAEWEVLDLPNPLGVNTVILAEWAEVLRPVYPERLEVTLRLENGGTSRGVMLWGVGPEWTERLRGFTR
ncbi:MAG: tRNA (adenosine(37)-N6)-threonylcarbamoyltransferase complex ATPase subunit type 1 TsaE [Sulfobacillus acidophilus]|uniref:tRNA threonylcarbamoyladenosine biosynthesis protein TsaE n=1 Tax=Sulfobacillus acidophilus TaxID=53633 RepID=A0A2T2WDZ5_9FIRM|nr:MAG: tRNA (adenosine(37)-N6)-threonylcarbamoyltransferase complex ATPase subunit type 1 TsaE [Sulfobacillus acidophilus]